MCTVGLALALGCSAWEPAEDETQQSLADPVAWIESSDGRLGLGAPPAATTIGDEVLSEARRGVVAVRAKGCGAVSNGTAFAVAPGLLIAAAHVLAGASSIEIEWTPSSADEPRVHSVDVVSFRQASDLALLRTDAAVPALSIDLAQIGTTGAILGFPGGSELEVTPARIEHYVSASGLWGDGTSRSVYVLAADVRSGQSGAPLIDENGSVVGVAFGTVRGPSQVGFALSRAELVEFLVSSGIDARIDESGRTVITVRPETLGEVPNGACELR